MHWAGLFYLPLTHNGGRLSFPYRRMMPGPMGLLEETCGTTRGSSRIYPLMPMGHLGVASYLVLREWRRRRHICLRRRTRRPASYLGERWWPTCPRHLGRTSMGGSRPLFRYARRALTCPPPSRTASSCLRSKELLEMVRHPSMVRTRRLFPHPSDRLAVVLRVGGHGRRASCEIWSPTSCGLCRCGDAQGTSRCLERTLVSCSIGSDGRELWQTRAGNDHLRLLQHGGAVVCVVCCRSTAPCIALGAQMASRAAPTLPSRGGARGGC